MISVNAIDQPVLEYLLTGGLHFYCLFPKFHHWHIEIVLLSHGLLWHCGELCSVLPQYTQIAGLLRCLFGCPAHVCCMVMIVACSAESYMDTPFSRVSIYHMLCTGWWVYQCLDSLSGSLSWVPQILLMFQARVAPHVSTSFFSSLYPYWKLYCGLVDPL